MILSLTGSDRSLIDSGGISPQPNPNASLGGFISSSYPPNNVINELFDSISQLTIEQQLTENICLGLINTLEGVSDVKIKLISSKGNLSKYKIAAVEVDKETYYTEKINSRYSSPISADFQDITFYKAFVDVTIKTIGSIGEEFVIEPFGAICTINKLEYPENKYDETYYSIVEGFKDLDYQVKRLSNNKFRIERKDETEESFPCELLTIGNLELTFEKDFENELNNSSFIKEGAWDKDSAVAIWIQRTVEKPRKISNEQMIVDYDNKEIVEKIETVELVIDYTKI